LCTGHHPHASVVSGLAVTPYLSLRKCAAPQWWTCCWWRIRWIESKKGSDLSPFRPNDHVWSTEGVLHSRGHGVADMRRSEGVSCYQVRSATVSVSNVSLRKYGLRNLVGVSRVPMLDRWLTVPITRTRRSSLVQWFCCPPGHSPRGDTTFCTDGDLVPAVLVRVVPGLGRLRGGNLCYTLVCSYLGCGYRNKTSSVFEGGDGSRMTGATDGVIAKSLLQYVRGHAASLGTCHELRTRRP
jgi:hypothetical protein